MSKEELDKLFSRIELEKSNDSCGFEFADGYDCTFDNIATCYDDRLKLYDLVKKYKEVIDKLKKHCEIEINASNHHLEIKHSQSELCHKVAHERILEILKEVE